MVRQFNRFYTRQMGLLREGLLDSPFTLTEVRVLYEVAHREAPLSSEISRDLGLNPSFVTRMLAVFRKRGLVEHKPSRSDRRQRVLSLTARGRRVLAPLEARSNTEVAKMLGRLSESLQGQIIEAMRSIEMLLGGKEGEQAPVVLRVHRHGALYAQEYGWDEHFEALVAEIAAEFIRHFDAKRERCWIAERGGEILGSVFLVKNTDEVAKLRLLLVEPRARGLGLGTRLVEECISFARQAGYRQIVLWTQSNLESARRIYKRTGFHLVKQEPHHSFGHDLVSETWALGL
jgi:DNA-binding MarR family transcriptional regulator/N-acetylglutamate synthase-like GNAT family acetyltransferase